MSEKERQLNRQSEPLNLNQGDYKNDEEKVRLAFAKLRLLNHGEEALSLEQAISRSRELSETYRRWMESAAPIKGIDVRLSNDQQIISSQINNPHDCGLRFNVNLPPDTVIHVWKTADDQFDEVLLISFPLSNIQSSGYQFEREYADGQTLSLTVEHCADEAFSVSVGLAEAKSQHLADVSGSHGIVHFGKLTAILGALRGPLTLRPAYALALMVMIMSSLGLHLLQRSPQLARVPIQTGAPPTPYISTTEAVAYDQLVESTATSVNREQQARARKSTSEFRKVKPSSALNNTPKSIYVEVYGSGDTNMDEYLRESFIRELKKTQLFNVVEGECIQPSDVCVNIQFTTSDVSPVEVTAKIMNKRGAILWMESKTRLSPSSDTLSEGVSRNLVSGIVRAFNQSTTEDDQSLRQRTDIF